jgi:hypothetical protein
MMGMPEMNIPAMLSDFMGCRSLSAGLLIS